MIGKPAPWQIVFSLKAFAAAMLALYIAFALDLSRPYWAMTTVYVVSQPFAGAIRSKGVFRLGGTIIGAAVGIALSGVVGSWEPGLIAGLVCWLFLCGYCAMRDRSPRNYFFLLAGMTALLVAWPGSSMTAGPIFEVAVSRVEEIGLGILCAVLVDSIVFPRRIAPVIDDQVKKWFADVQSWAIDILTAREGRSLADRAKLAADAQQIEAMAVHLEYEGKGGQRATRWLRALRGRMLAMLPVLSSIEDRVGALRSEPLGMPPVIEEILAETAAWLDQGMLPEGTDRLKARIDAYDVRNEEGPHWRRILLTGLCMRLSEFLTIAEDCRILREQIRTPRRKPSSRLRHLARPSVVSPHVDHGMIAWAIGASFLSFSVAAGFWYLTGWQAGSSAAMMALLMSLFFGGMDNPMPMLRMLIKVFAFTILFDIVYLFVILPSVHSFPTLILVLLPALLPLGILASDLSTFMVALMPIAMMTLQGSATTAFAPFLEGMVGVMTGIVIVFLVSGVVKAVSADVSLRRVVHAGWRDIERISSALKNADLTAFSDRMLDRLGLLVPRLAAVGEAPNAQAGDAFSDIRLGSCLIALQEKRNVLDGERARIVQEVLSGVAAHYRGLRADPHRPADPALLARIDEGLFSALYDPRPSVRRPLVLGLAGIRRALFPDSPPPPDGDRPTREEGTAALAVAAE